MEGAWDQAEGVLSRFFLAAFKLRRKIANGSTDAAEVIPPHSL